MQKKRPEQKKIVPPPQCEVLGREKKKTNIKRRKLARKMQLFSHRTEPQVPCPMLLWLALDDVRH